MTMKWNETPQDALLVVHWAVSHYHIGAAILFLMYFPTVI